MDIRAQNGQLLRMCCTLGTDTCLFAGDAQVARTSYSNFGTLSFLYDAIQIHSSRKPSRVRSMMIRFRFLLLFFTQRPCLDLRCQAPLLTYAAALLGPPLPGPHLLTQRPCLDLRCQALTHVLTYVAAMHGGRDASIPLCLFVSAIKIPGLGLFFGRTE